MCGNRIAHETRHVGDKGAYHADIHEICGGSDSHRCACPCGGDAEPGAPWLATVRRRRGIAAGALIGAAAANANNGYYYGYGPGYDGEPDYAYAPATLVTSAGRRLLRGQL